MVYALVDRSKPGTHHRLKLTARCRTAVLITGAEFRGLPEGPLTPCAARFQSWCCGSRRHCSAGGKNKPRGKYKARCARDLPPTEFLASIRRLFYAVLRLKTHQPFVLSSIEIQATSKRFLQRINIGRFWIRWFSNLFKLPCQLMARIAAGSIRW